MAIIRLSEYLDPPGPPADEMDEYNRAVNAWLRSMLEHQHCISCGREVWRKSVFLHWHGAGELVLCADCAPSVLRGLNRDLVELSGGEDAKYISGQTEPRDYGVMTMRQQIIGLQQQAMKLLQRIVVLQQEMGRPD